MDFGTDGLARLPLDGYFGGIQGIAIQADNKIVGGGNNFLLVRILNDVTSNLTNINYGNAPILYPNPVAASSQISIQVSASASANDVLEFLSVTGQLIYSKPMGNAVIENQSISSTLPTGITNGVYLVRISQNGIPGRAAKLVVIK